MSNVKLDLSKFKHVSSDKNSTKLRHQDGHFLVISHRPLSKDNQDQLAALARPMASKDIDLSKDSPAKMADGGEAGIPCKNPQCKSFGKVHPNCRCFAKGGCVKAHDQSCTHLAEGGVSEQGRDVRFANNQKEHGKSNGSSLHGAREEAKGRAEFERKHVKPKMKGLADGGEVPAPMPDKQKAQDAAKGAEHGETMSDGWQNLKNEFGIGDFKPTTSMPKKYAEGGPAQPEEGPPGYDNSVDPAVDEGEAPVASHRDAIKTALSEIITDAFGNKKPEQGQPNQPPASLAMKPGMPGSQPQQPQQPGQMQSAQPQDQEQQPQGPPSSPEQAQEQALDQITPKASPPPLDASGGPNPDASAETPAGIDQTSQSMPTQYTPPQDYEGLRDTIKRQYLEEDMAFQHDLNNGHIAPQTYKDLFAKKDTLGKIGSIFGMLLAGAGSGLTHQPNLAVQMMDKVISNDLEAQKASKGNANNFNSLNQQRLLQQGQISKMVQEGRLTANQAQTLRQDLAIKGDAFSRMQANRAALHDMSDMVQKLPANSPQRQQAEATLAMLAQSVNTENYNLADRAAAQSALLGYAGGENQPKSGEQDFQAKNKMLRMSGNDKLAVDNESKHMPGFRGAASDSLGGQDREQLNAGVSFDKQLDKFIDWTKKHSGELSLLHPTDFNTGKALAADLQGAYRLATHGGVYKEGEQNFISKLIDEDPTKFFNKIRVLPQLQAIKSTNVNKLDQLAKSKGFDGYSGVQRSEQQETIERKDPTTGKTVIFDAKTKKPIRWK